MAVRIIVILVIFCFPFVARGQTGEPTIDESLINRLAPATAEEYKVPITAATNYLKLQHKYMAARDQSEKDGLATSKLQADMYRALAASYIFHAGGIVSGRNILEKVDRTPNGLISASLEKEMEAWLAVSTLAAVHRSNATLAVNEYARVYVADFAECKQRPGSKACVDRNTEATLLRSDQYQEIRLGGEALRRLWQRISALKKSVTKL